MKHGKKLLDPKKVAKWKAQHGYADCMNGLDNWLGPTLTRTRNGYRLLASLGHEGIEITTSLRKGRGAGYYIRISAWKNNRKGTKTHRVTPFEIGLVELRRLCKGVDKHGHPLPELNGES